jgi:hypothetical protein
LHRRYKHHSSSDSCSKVCTYSAGQRTREAKHKRPTRPPLLDRTFWTVWKGRDRLRRMEESDSSDIYRACGRPDRRHGRKSSAELLPSRLRAACSLCTRSNTHHRTLLFLASGGTGMANNSLQFNPGPVALDRSKLSTERRLNL